MTINFKYLLLTCFFYVGMWHITVKNPISYQYTIFLNVPFSRNIWLMSAVYQSVPLFPSTYILLINTVFFYSFNAFWTNYTCQTGIF